MTNGFLELKQPGKGANTARAVIPGFPTATTFRRALPPFVDSRCLLVQQFVTISSERRCDPTDCRRTSTIDPLRTVRSDMVSHVTKAPLDVVCTRCSKRIQWAWVVEYQSYHFIQFIYLCSECGAVLKVTRKKTRSFAPEEDQASAALRIA
jgi:DNA-directed RNA polymerase subunit RPC12/RpoP